MQQRQLRVGDILDDYCPRERRLTDHAIVAMVGDDIKQTRCTTCEAEHEYKHAKVPRQRSKADSPAALYQQVAAAAPKRVAHDTPDGHRDEPAAPMIPEAPVDEPAAEAATAEGDPAPASEPSDPDDAPDREEGPVHRQLIRASLPRPEGQPPPSRPLPEFTIRQPGGRANRFRPRHQRGGQGFRGASGGGNNAGGFRGGGQGRGPGGGGGGRPPHGGPPRHARHHDHGRKRSK
jgi:translation initiation factor IF-2